MTMNGEFRYVDDVLWVEGVPLPELVEAHGSPLYVYSRSHLRRRYRALADAMARIDPLICYSVKANSNGAIVRTFLDEGAGLDIVSGGELFRSLRAGADPGKVVFAGVGKTRGEIRYALEQGIRFFTVESEPEAARISDCAGELGVTGRIAFRVNPDVDPQTHRYISTGKGENKFGLDLPRAAAALDAAAALPGVEVVGVHMHIGSQILAAQPYVEALEKVVDECLRLKDRYASFSTIDIGGGLGIRYEPGQAELDPRDFAAAVTPLLSELGLAVILEPGRSLVGNAGVLVCRVEYVKQNAFKRFVVVDAGMNDLLRPSLYQAYHEILPVGRADGAFVGDVVGPICESGDFLALDRELPAVGEGDLLAVAGAGAYGFAMASTYNSRPRPAEVMVEGDKVSLIRERETWNDLVRREAPIED